MLELRRITAMQSRLMAATRAPAGRCSPAVSSHWHTDAICSRVAAACRPDMADFVVAVCRQQADYTAGCNDAGTARFLSSTYTGSSSARHHGRWHCQICIAG